MTSAASQLVETYAVHRNGALLGHRVRRDGAWLWRWPDGTEQPMVGGQVPSVRIEARARRAVVKRAEPLGAVEPPNLPWRFTLLGAPATKGNSRAGAGTIPSAAYRRWFHAVEAQLPIVRATCHGVVSEPVAVAAVFYRRARVGDLDNFLKACGDVLQKLGLVVNDRLIASWDGSRLEVDRERPRVEVTLTAATRSP